ncbi:MAG: hypothetical protein K2J80_10590 [Oscillospiraceae bacterium]|nr:hypothetical protein [Oscillospiraceae bacterium]
MLFSNSFAIIAEALFEPISEYSLARFAAAAIALKSEGSLALAVATKSLKAPLKDEVLAFAASAIALKSEDAALAFAEAV